MSKKDEDQKHWLLQPQCLEYINKVSLRDDIVSKELREITSKHERSIMQISAEEGQFLNFLIKLTNAKLTLEIGVFTGYSALKTAQALPKDGKIIALDISEEYTNIAKEYWKKAGVDEKIDLRIAPATETLQKLLKEGYEGNADKPNYDSYYETCLKLVKKGGIIAIDNTLWFGKLWDEKCDDESTVLLRKLNEKIAKDDRVDITMIPMADGITLCRVL